MNTPNPSRFHTRVVISDSTGAQRGHGCLIAKQVVLVHPPFSYDLARLKQETGAESLTQLNEVLTAAGKPSFGGLTATLIGAENGSPASAETIEIEEIDTAEGTHDDDDPLVAVILRQPTAHIPDKPPHPYPPAPGGIAADRGDSLADTVDLYGDDPGVTPDIVALYREMLDRHLDDTPPGHQLLDGPADGFSIDDWARGGICKIFKDLKWCKK